MSSQHATALRLQLTGIALVLFGGLWDVVQIIKPYGDPQGGVAFAVIGLVTVLVGLVGPGVWADDGSESGAEAGARDGTGRERSGTEDGA